MGFIYQNLFVDNLDALAALTDTSTPKRVDGVFLGVENNGEGHPGWYRYYSSSSAANDRPGVVASSDSIGAWFSFSGAGSADPGQSAYTTTTASYTHPTVGSNATVQVANSSWMAVGQTVFISGGGTYTVASIPSATSVSLTNLYTTNTAPGSTIASPRMVVSSGIKGEDGNPGQGAYTTTTASYAQPAVGDSVTISVVSTAWMAPGQTVFISGGGTYSVAAINSPTSVNLISLYETNTAPTSIIAASQMVVASGIKGSTGATGTVNATTAIVLNPTATPPSTAANEVDIYANTDNELNYREPSDGDIYEVGDRSVPVKLFLISLLS